MLAGWLLCALGAVTVVAALNALWPQTSIMWPGRLGTVRLGVSWLTAMLVVELAVHLLVTGAIVVAVLTLFGALDTTPGVVGLVLWIAGALTTLTHAAASLRTRVDVDGRPGELDLDADAPHVPRTLMALPLLAPWRRGVHHRRGVVFAEIGRKRLRLDVYRSDAPPPSVAASERRRPRSRLAIADQEPAANANAGASGAPAEPRKPAVIWVHGGAWIMGSRREQGLPLLNHLAANGWVGISIDYRLSPRATLPDHVVDVKRAIAWVREHANELGVDPGFIALAGGSAGGHLCALAALTDHDAALQPGFEASDTRVQAAVPFYGVYDFCEDEIDHARALRRLVERVVVKADRDEAPERFAAVSPLRRIHADAPPFFVVHGSKDTLVPVAESRVFTERLRDVAEAPVLYAEMRGAEHAFDVFPTIRTVRVLRAIERFLTVTYETWREGEADGRPAYEAELAG